MSENVIPHEVIVDVHARWSQDGSCDCNKKLFTVFLERPLTDPLGRSDLESLLNLHGEILTESRPVYCVSPGCTNLLRLRNGGTSKWSDIPGRKAHSCSTETSVGASAKKVIITPIHVELYLRCPQHPGYVCPSKQLKMPKEELGLKGKE
jgi:hypothetical protein